MTDDRIKGAVRKGAGHVQDAVGGLTGDGETQAKGKVNEIAGSAQNAYGKVVGKAEDAYSVAQDKAQHLFEDVKEFVKAQPYAACGAALIIGIGLGLALRGSDD